MSWWSRIANVFHSDRVNREIDEELQSHLADAIEHGREPAEARRAIGSALQQREQSRDLKLLPWLDSLRADAVFGWRQIRKHKATSAAAILSLGLAIGSCTAAFRLADALLFRPLPVADPGQLYEISRHGIDPEGHVASIDEWAYPMLRDMRAAIQGDAELIPIGPAEPTDVTYASDAEMEKAYVQNVGGSMFASFGLHPVAGRLLTEDDDREPRAHPYAVLSYDYWSRRFGQDKSVIGRSLRMDGVVSDCRRGGSPVCGH